MKSVKNSAQFGNLIKKIRKQAQLTQKELAASCGTGVRFIQELEKGKGSCELDKALHVASMLGVRFSARLPILKEEHE
ncbi:MAG: helix-turn-helix domain-containing protein [Candidatus Berkiella sp.]